MKQKNTRKMLKKKKYEEKNIHPKLFPVQWIELKIMAYFVLIKQKKGR